MTLLDTSFLAQLPDQTKSWKRTRTWISVEILRVTEVSDNDR